MSRNQVLLVAVSLLIGLGIGYWAASPKNNLEPIQGVAQTGQDPHAMMMGGAPESGSCPGNHDSSGAAPEMGMSPAGMGGMSMEPASPEVLAAAEQKLSADPKNPELMVEVARLKRRMGNADEAATLLKKALSVKSDLPSALFEMAVLSMHDSNDQAKAIEYFEKYLKAAPNGPKAEMARKAVETLKSEGAR